MHIRSVTKVRPAPANDDLLGSLDVLSYLLQNISQAVNILNGIYGLIHSIAKDISSL